MQPHFPLNSRVRVGSLAAALGIVAILAALVAGPLVAQFVPTFSPLPATAVPAAAEPVPPSDAAQEPSEFEGGAPLKTDPELERLLERAAQFRQQNRLDVAVVLWQKALNESGDTLVTENGRTYTSLAEKVERILARLPPEGLKAYRLNADGEAVEQLAAGGDREQALARVVRRYFLSTQGDNAAFELGSLALDRHDFVGASRLLEKVLREYPDSDLPRDPILWRLAVANAHLGDQAAAQANLQAISPAAAPREVRDYVALLARGIPSRTGAAALAGRWHTRWGNASRTGVQPDLPANALRGTLTEAWSRQFELPGAQNAGLVPAWGPKATYVGSTIVFAEGYPISISGPSGTIITASPPASDRAALVDRWKSQIWRPTEQLLFDGDRIYCKSSSGLACWNTRPLAEEPAWLSAWSNRYELDSQTRLFAQLGMPGNSERPTELTAVQLFGDRVHASFSLCEGVVYSLEGRRIVTSGENRRDEMGDVSLDHHWGVMPRRTRRNWLTAYDSQSGKVRWSRAADEADKQGNTGFLAAPVQVGAQLLVPVTDGGAIWLFALAPADGATTWKTYLCDEPSGGCEPWSPVCVAAEGSEVYVCAGVGVVFALEGTTGTLRWAARYSRSGNPNQQLAQHYGQASSPRLDLTGWQDDAIVPTGATLLVMASDHDRLLALDRRTGAPRWETPQLASDEAPVSYCLGVAGGGVFVAGPNVVRRYDIAGGKLAWERQHDSSFGQAALTASAVYVPVRDSILKLATSNGQELAQVGVSQTVDDPVGNLFSDGETLWVVGLNRIAALTNIEHRFEQLAAAILQGNAQANFDRMVLRYRLRQFNEAQADLASTYELLLKQQKPWQAAETLLRGIDKIDLPRRHPLATLELVQRAPPETPPRNAEEVRLAERVALQRRALRSAAIWQVRSQKPANAVNVLLATAPDCDAGYQLNSLKIALQATATLGELPALQAAVTSDSAAKRNVAVECLLRLGGEEALAQVRPLLADADEVVTLAAARALLARGEREALPVLVRLLDSQRAEVRHQALRCLNVRTGETHGFSASDLPAARTAALERWRQWLQEHAANANLHTGGDDEPPLLGRTLVCYGGTHVEEFDEQRNVTWRTQLPGASAGQGLSNGHRLVCSHQERTVYEFDASGKEIWRRDRISGSPAFAERLANGRTLVVCPDTQSVWEFSPEGKTEWQTRVEGGPVSAQRLPSGLTLLALQGGGRVAEVNVQGKIVWQITGLASPGSAQRLENGNTLVALVSANEVVELDRSGNRVAAISDLTAPQFAQRLPDGNTVVVDQHGVHDFDGHGRRASTLQVFGAYRAHRY